MRGTPAGLGVTCVHGYVWVAEAEAHFHGGNLDKSLDLARRVTTVGAQFADPNLVNIGLHQAGRALVALGYVAGGPPCSTRRWSPSSPRR